MRSESKARFRRPRRLEVVSVRSNFLPSSSKIHPYLSRNNEGLGGEPLEIAPRS
jgi:hypothetical protein